MTRLEREIRMDRERVVTATPPGPLHACPADAVGTAASRQPSRPFVAGRSSRPTRPGRLIGGFAAAALLALSALFAAPMPASAQSDIWSATMTVGISNRGSSIESIGYRIQIGLLTPHGSITDNTFSIDGTPYTVSGVYYGPVAPAGLKLILNRALPEGLVLHLGDSSFSVSDATETTAGGFTIHSWATHGLNWADDATVAVRLAPALPTVGIAAVADTITVNSGSIAIARFTVSRTGSTDGTLYFRIRMNETGGTGFHLFGPGQSTVTISHMALDKDNDGNPICSITFALVSTDTYGISATASEAAVNFSPRPSDCSTATSPVRPPPVYGGLAVRSFPDAIEGTDDTLDFEVTLHPAAAARVTVDYATENGTARAGADYTAVNGTLTFEVGETRKTISVPIIDDNVEDSRETVRLRLSNASGATITLNGQYGTIWNSEEERQAALNASVIGPLGLSVADARVQEAANATVDFTVTLSRAGTATVTVDYATSDGSSPNGATAGADYTAASGTLTFAPGETAKTISVPVIDDSHDEVQEIFTLTLSNASGDNAWLSDATATGTIENTDAMPQAWLARFGRTVAGHVLDAVSERMRAPRAAGLSATLGSQALPGMDFSGDPAARPTETETETREAGVRARALSDWLNGETGDNGDGARGIGSRTVTGRELVLGSTFSLTGETSDGGTAGFWGRAAVSGFDGREGDLSLDGEVTTGLLGADYGRGRWLMGLIASHSRGEGSYRGSSAGTVSSALTGLHPWARYAVSERLSVWGAAGYGAGTLTLEPESEKPMKADLSLAMAAAGARGDLLEAPGDAGGPALALVGDAMFVRTESERTTGLVAASADVTRLRLALDGSWRFVLEGGPALTPSLELGVRHDGGDAETGFGVDIGGGLVFADPKRGLTFDVSARALVAHEESGYRERGIAAALSFDPLPSTDRGLTMSLRQTLGAASTGGANALMRRETLTGLGANDDSDARRLELTAGYGIAMFDGRFTGTPELGVGLTDAGRDYRLGWRLGPGWGGGTSFELGLEAARRESANDDEAEHTAGFRIRAAW